MAPAWKAIQGKSITGKRRKAAESGDDAYAETGSADDYLFSVRFDEDSECFTLTLNGVNISTTDTNECGIDSNSSLNTVLVDGKSNSVSNSHNTIYAYKNIDIRGSGSLTATADPSCSGIYSEEGDITIEEGTVIAFGITAICAYNGTTTISGGSVTAWGTRNGVWSKGTVTISGGSVTVTATDTASCCRSIYTSGSVSVTASPYKYRTNASASAPETDYTLSSGTPFSNSGDYNYVEIIPCPDTYVGDVKVSGVTNSGNISYWLNDRSGSIKPYGATAEHYNVKYDESTQTLTLKDAEITSFYSDGKSNYGIYPKGNLNIVLEGSNLIGPTETPECIEETAGIFCGGNLSLSAASGGSLSIVSAGYGLYSKGNTAVDGSAVLNICAESYGIFADGSLYISGGSAASGTQQVLRATDAIGVTMTSYKYRTNTSTEASTTAYSFYPDSAFSTNDVAGYKYVRIAETFGITSADADNGSFTVSVEGIAAVKAAAGDTVTLTAAPASGYSFSAWNVHKTGDPGTAVSVSGNSFPMPAYPVTAEASFTAATPANSTSGGSVTTLASQLKQINGVWYLACKASEFSPYALVVTGTGVYEETAGLPYYIDSNGNDVFIGFAANGKYIAPSGVTVLFKENAKTFTDIDSHWAGASIGFVTERELFLGNGSDAFSPDSGMTRGMFAAVIGRLYERSYGEIQAASTHAFIDCNYDAYYGKYVDWAAENGILGDYGNGKFRPGNLVFREQMAAILYRFAEFLGVLPDDVDTELRYSDANSISGYAKNAALYCQTSGIITGRKGGSFAPQGTAARAEVVVILEWLIKNILS